MSKSSVSAFLGFIVGAAAGTAMGMLFAPEKGASTRKKLKDQAKKVSEEVTETLSDQVQDLNKYLKGFVSDTQEKIADLESKTKREIKEVKDKATK